MTPRFVAGALTLAALFFVRAASAQQTDSAATGRTIRFSGTIASMSTTKPVTFADVRIIYIDSVHANRDNSKELGEMFVDSAKSRVGVTDTTGAFAIRNVTPGHYLINVRRLGFEPFEGVLTLDTLPIEMELTLTQIAQVLPPITISSKGMARAALALDRSGFNSRSNMGTSGTFIDRTEILRRKVDYVTDMLRAYGIERNARIIMDRMQSDWDVLSSYPLDLVIGVEIYRQRGSLPTEFDATLKAANAFSNYGGSGGTYPPTVIVWTYVP